MKKNQPHDLATVRAMFENWRAVRQGRERIPEKLWQSAIELLAYYPFHKVRKELNLNTKQLRQRAEVQGKLMPSRSTVKKVAQQISRSKPAFLEMTAADLAKTLPLSNNHQLINGSEQTCRIVFERADGSRLSLSLPVELNLIQSICNGFIKA